MTTQSSWLDRTARLMVVGQLSSLRRGEIVLTDAGGSESFGQPTDLRVTLRVHRPRFFRQAVLGGTLAVAESYRRGDWDCDDLTTFFRIFIRNNDTASRFDRGVAWLAGWGHRLVHAWNANTRRGSRRNIEAHYDLGNEFFQLWLDETMAYSSGIFPMPDATMRDASIEKFDRICRKLELTPGDHVLEIGTGWGGFALHAAGQYGSRVTTTTISPRQFEIAGQRVHAAGLSERVTLLQQDYRDLKGSFTKLASIEMIEAVGHRYFDQYFRQCDSLLRPDGTMVIQAIVMPEARYDAYRKSTDFIQHYIFPGGCLPSMAAMLESVGRTSRLRFVHAEDFAPHYAETLRRWRSAFIARLPDVRRLDYSEEFIRLWTYYLCYCEAAFEERAIGVVQVQLDGQECQRDPIELNRLASARPSRLDPVYNEVSLPVDSHRGEPVHEPSTTRH